MGPSACKGGLWGIVALFFFVFLPHKPRLHALGPIALRLSAIYEYGVLQAGTPFSSSIKKASSKRLSFNFNFLTFVLYNKTF